MTYCYKVSFQLLRKRLMNDQTGRHLLHYTMILNFLALTMSNTVISEGKVDYHIKAFEEKKSQIQQTVLFIDTCRDKWACSCASFYLGSQRWDWRVVKRRWKVFTFLEEQARRNSILVLVWHLRGLKRIQIHLRRKYCWIIVSRYFGNFLKHIHQQPHS